MDICEYGLQEIEKEKFHRALGIKDKNNSNHGLARRDYTVKCSIPHRIITLKGYFVWWCSSHYQPHFVCQKHQIKARAKEFAEAILNAENRTKMNPPPRTKWLTSEELAEQFLKDEE